MQIAGPIRINEAFTVTTTITGDKDFANVEVAFASDAPDLLIQDQQAWKKGTQAERIELKAKQSSSVSRKVLMSKAREFIINVSAMGPTFRAEDSVHIILTQDGGKAYQSGEAIPTAPFRRLPTVPPEERLKAPLTPPSALGTPAPPLGNLVTPVLPTAPPPTQASVPPTPAGRPYP